MGFSGHLVFARSERPLRSAPLFGSIEQEGLKDRVHEWWPRPGDWQTLELPRGIWDGGWPPEFDEAVRRKRAELDAEVPTDAEGALLWASAAGIRTAGQRPRIEELLRSQDPFAEDLFSALPDELGFPEAAQPSQP